MTESVNKNKGGMIVLLIFLLICSGFGIAAFVMSFTKKCGEGFEDKKITLVKKAPSKANKTSPTPSPGFGASTAEANKTSPTPSPSQLAIPGFGAPHAEVNKPYLV